MDWLEQIEAAEHRLEAARRATSPLWRLRHMRAALEHMLVAMRDLGEDAGDVPAGREPIRAGRL